MCTVAAVASVILYCTVHCLLLQNKVPQTLVQKFGVAAVRGVARNKSIAEFELEPAVLDPQVVDGMLAQLTPDERRRFRVKEGFFSSIELCPVGEWSLSLSSCSICAVSVTSSVSCT